jgi:hypothetical protein
MAKSGHRLQNGDNVFHRDPMEPFARFKKRHGVLKPDRSIELRNPINLF